jgi:hypothetical protein
LHDLSAKLECAEQMICYTISPEIKEQRRGLEILHQCNSSKEFHKHNTFCNNEDQWTSQRSKLVYYIGLDQADVPWK